MLRQCVASRPFVGLPNQVRSKTTVTTTNPASITNAASSSPSLAKTGKRSLLTAYLSALNENPKMVKSISALVIFSAGDVSTQFYNHAKNERRSDSGNDDRAKFGELVETFTLDGARTLRLSSFGLIATMTIHTWWGLLEPFTAKIFNPVEEKLKNTALKVVLDQSIGATIYNVLFFFSLGLMNGKSPASSFDDVRNGIPDQMLRHWSFWPWFHCVNFYVNPLHLR